MLCFNRIEGSEGTDVNKTNLNYSFKFQPNVSNRFHYLLMVSMNLSNIAIFNINGSDCCCIISLISKNVAIKVMKKVEHYKTSNFIYKNWVKKF